ncbi:MAG: host specificity factor TipJ family phage tail protein [Hyphomicrobiaceae bacterium]
MQAELLLPVPRSRALTVPTSVAVFGRHPFDWGRREVKEISALMTIADVADAHEVHPTLQPVVCVLDGRFVLRKDWATTVVAPRSVVMFQAIPQGGGAGGKNILRTVLAVAVMVLAIVVAPYLAPGLAAATGLTVATSTTLISAGIAIGGSMLLNAIIPPQQANVNTNSATATYSISGRQNLARLDSPIPVLYGRHIMSPDYAATPWSEFIANKQYLYQLLVIGEGEYDIEQIRMGTALLSSYTDMQTEIIPPGGTVTLIDANVYSSRDVGSQMLLGSNEFTTLKVPLAAETAPWPLSAVITATVDTSSGWTSGLTGQAVGPFAACPSTAVTDQIGLDIILPRGLFSPGPSGSIGGKSISWNVYAQPIDSGGMPLADWVLISAEYLALASVDPQRKSFRYTMPSVARWQVALFRTITRDTSYNAGHDLNWAGLRGFLEPAASYGNITLLALKALATSNLNSSNAQSVTVVATRKLPVWDGASWSVPQPTRSIAWIAADILRNTVYGGKLPDSRIALDDLLALDAIWEARGDAFNGVFDSASTVWDALATVLRCGRAKAYFQSGRIRFLRDQPPGLPVAMFALPNIVAKSVTMTFIMPVTGETANGVEASYLDESTWSSNTIHAVPGGVVGPTDILAREQLKGVTNLAQAQREADYMAAANRYRRAFLMFSTELDGMIPSLGDPILVAHDIPKWGLSGKVVAWDPGTRMLTLDNEVSAPTGQSWWVWLRQSNGKVSAATEVVSQPGLSQLILAAAPGFTVHTSGAREATYWALGSSTEQPKLCLVTMIRPRGNTVEISAVIDDARVYVN